MADAVASMIDRMAATARAFMAALEPGQRAKATAAFDAADRREFTYLPGPRPGLALADMSADQQARAMDLLATGLSGRGLADAHAIMRLEETLAEIERTAGRPGWERRHPEYFWFRVLGEPGGAHPWAWTVGGHHLAVHVTVVGESIAGTPLFFGANPATVPAVRPQAGLRTLPDDEDLGRALVTALSADLRAATITDPVAPRDILTRHDPVADTGRIPSGLAYAQMAAEPRELLVRLVRHYLGRAVPDVGETAWAEIEHAGLERVSFRWAGPVEPGHGHYYAVVGPTFLLEYDNTQNDANHIHTVWRDLRRDWGEDLLAAHYGAHRH
jgi:Protein of unknown function (DUF3500)